MGLSNICEADDCGRPLKPGDRVVQFAHGRYFPAQITPTYGDFEGDSEVHEWHVECFREFKLTEQSGPYKCLRCGKSIHHAEYVYYITVGTKYSLHHIRLSDRGKKMPWIIHAADCALKKAI